MNNYENEIKVPVPLKTQFLNTTSEETMSPTDALEKIKRAKEEKIPELKEYTNLFFTQRNTFARKLAQKYSKEIKIKSYKFDTSITTLYDEFWETDEDRLTVEAFELKTDNFWCFFEYFPFLNYNGLLLFFKDKKRFEKEIGTLGFFYNVGSYYLENTPVGYTLTNVILNREDAPELNDDFATEINRDIENFFNKEKFYRDNKLTFKRGILLHGPPGNGKTSLIKSIVEKHKDKYCILIDCTKEFRKDAGDFLRQSLGNKKKIIIFEDIDGISSYSRSSLLNFIDGLDTIENTVFIATSNNISKIDSALVNRPSRFDRVYAFEPPTTLTRKKLLKRFFTKLSEEELNEYARQTDGFSGAYFKELFIFTNIQECTMEESIKNMKKHHELFKKTKDTDYLG